MAAWLAAACSPPRPAPLPVGVKGYGEIPLGMRLEDAPDDMVLDPVLGDVLEPYRVFHRPDEPLRFGEVPLARVWYYFLDDKLVITALLVQSEEGCSAFSNALQTEYGLEFPRMSIWNSWKYVQFRNPDLEPQNEDVRLSWMWQDSNCGVFYHWKHAWLVEPTAR